MNIAVGEAGPFSRSELTSVAALLAQVFPGERDWGEELAWQYVANPLGPALRVNATFETGKVVGHYAVIPLPRLAEPSLSHYRVFLSLNTAVHADAQGKGLFKTTAARLFDYLEDSGPTVILGVANDNSVGGFVRSLGFFRLGQLSLRFYLPWQSPRPEMPRALETPRDYLAWRSQRPGVRTVKEASTGTLSRIRRHKGIAVEGLLTVGADRAAVDALKAPGRRLWETPIRLYACSGRGPGRGIPVPERLRPSPLHYICRVLPEKNENKVVNYLSENRFEFLDFDVM